LELKDEGANTIKYNLSVNERVITKEKLGFNGKPYLERSRKVTEITSLQSKSKATINPPKDSLAIHVRRDTAEYPFFEQLIAWAENCYWLKFGEISNNLPGNDIIDLSDAYELLDTNSRKSIIANWSSIDFPIASIKSYPISEKNENRLFTIDINEKRVGVFPIRDLSQGMYRALYILTFIEYLVATGNPQTIIIDDLCEGLDYSRATKLGTLLFEFCRTHKIQLIASSNDGFLMDVIDLEYWNVLQRDGGKVSAINYTNSKDLFDGFKFTGLSNFDFFSSDYIEQHRKQ
jgi:hypothetical protein